MNDDPTMKESQRRFFEDLPDPLEAIRRADPLEAIRRSESQNDSTDPKDPWEIGLLGGFIFSLGYKFGVAGVSRSAFSPNLLAHSPIDPYLGDFLGKSDFRGFLVEFKRDWGERRTEQKKEKFKILYTIERCYETAKCHFLGYGYETSTGKFDLKFGNYLELVHAENEGDVKCYCLDEFLEGIVEERIGANFQQFSAYLENVIERLKMHFNTSSNAKERSQS
jgi:hypothetical protein